MDATEDAVDRRTRDRLRARAQVIKAMAHPTRLFLVEELARSERCVLDLTARVGDDVSTVSRHLGVLRGAGIVSSQRRGQQVFYRLDTPCVLGFFDCIEGVLHPSRAERAPGGAADGCATCGPACGETRGDQGG